MEWMRLYVYNKNKQNVPVSTCRWLGYHRSVTWLRLHKKWSGIAVLIQTSFPQLDGLSNIVRLRETTMSLYNHHISHIDIHT